jgi:hypothetical protein
MKNRQGHPIAAALLALALLAGGGAAWAAAELPGTLSLDGKTLQLNGSGTRYKAVFRVYDAGLYAAAPVRTLEQWLAQPGPKALRLLARRDLPADELGKMLVKGINEGNPREDVMRQLTGLAQVGGMFGSRSQVAAGESFGFNYLPGTGTVLLVNDKPVGEPVRDPAFFPLMMRIWLGNQPVDPRLKAALLGASKPTADERMVANGL